MDILEAIILGIVQGIAEFLPVSSSGHLQIAKEMLGVTLTDNLTFDVMLHVATVLATVVVLRRDVSGLLGGAVTGIRRRRYNPQVAYLLKIALSMVPVAIVGLLFRDELNAMLSSPHILLVVGVMLFVTAGLLVFAGRAREHEGRKGEISYKSAFVIGIAQACAAMPGLSRSGSTIATGLLLGNKRSAVARFSFLMVIPPILGEALIDLVRGFEAVRPTGGVFGLSVTGAEILPYAAGFVAAFGVGCAACRLMIRIVERSRLVWFAAYCAVVGVATVIYYFV